MKQLDDACEFTTRNAFRALNSVVKPAVMIGAGNPFPVGGGAIVLEVTGRKSGEPRQVPVLATRVGDKLMVSTVRGDSQWLANIEADENVVVHLYGQRRPAIGEVTRGPLNTVLLTLV